ncbi:unnamed protein product [Discosporangium mesarthrocarpum]
MSRTGRGAGSGAGVGSTSISFSDTVQCSDGSVSGVNGQAEKEPASGDQTPADFLGPLDRAGGCTLLVVNVTATSSVKCKLDLQNIVMRARNAEYNPRRFSACVIRLTDPKATALVFSSGKMVVTGSKSESMARLACRKFNKIIEKLGNDVQLSDFAIQNMVATTDVKFPLRLEGLVASSHSQFCSYEPELFPGLIYRLAQPKVCLLIFVSGKVVLTGGKSIANLREAFIEMYPVLCSFRKSSVLVNHISSSSTSTPSKSSSGPEGSGNDSGSGSGRGGGEGGGSRTGKRPPQGAVTGEMAGTGGARKAAKIT